MLRIVQIAVAAFVVTELYPLFMNFVHTMNTVSTTLNP